MDGAAVHAIWRGPACSIHRWIRLPSPQAGGPRFPPLASLRKSDQLSMSHPHESFDGLLRAIAELVTSHRRTGPRISPSRTRGLPGP
jgi:hypothetical protein